MNKSYSYFRSGLIAFLVLLGFSSSSAQAQCILFPGNLVFTGVNVDDGEDEANGDDRFSFVLLQDLSAGFEVKFTDLGWTNSNSFQTSERAPSDGVIVWTVPVGGLEAGQQVTINSKYGLTADFGTVVGLQETEGEPGVFMNLGLSGDQLFAFTGDISSPTFIAGINLNHAWGSLASNELTSSKSALPAGLSISNVQNTSLISSFSNGFTNAVLSGSSFSGLFSTIVASLNSSSNWSFDETYLPAPIPDGFVLPKTLSFTVTPFNFLNAPTGTSTITYGDNTQFTVTKVDSRNILTYQWQLSTDGGTSFDQITEGGIYSGVASNTLLITKPPVSNSNYQYRVYAVDACGNETFSSVITLTVNQKTLTANLIGTIQKERDGTTGATILDTNLELVGVVDSDQVQLVNPGTGTYASALPGSNIQVSVSGLSITGTDMANYVLNPTTATANIGVIVDTTPPSGYKVTIDQELINLSNQNAVSFTFADAEIGTTFSYSFSSDGGGTPVTGLGTVTSAMQQVTGINATGLNEGTITLSVFLTDPSGNVGDPETDTSTKTLTPILDGGRRLDYRENDPPVSFSSGGDLLVLANGVNISEAVITFLDKIEGDILAAGDTGPFTVSTVGDVITLSGTGTASQMSAALNSITYVHDGDDPDRANSDDTRAVEIFVEDELGRLSPTVRIDIVIESVNDAPTVADLPSDVIVIENTASSLDLSLATFSDVDAGTLPITLSLQVNFGTMQATTGGGVIIGGSGTPSITMTGSQFAINSYLNTPSNIQYTGPVNLLGDDADLLTLSANDGGNSGEGGGTSVELGTVNIDIVSANDAPTVANPIENQNATQDVFFNFIVPVDTFEDVDGDDLTYSAQLAGGGALPVWLSFDADTRTFSGTPLNANVGTVSIDVIANDNNGGTVTDTFDIIVANVNDSPTVANPIPDQNATEDVAFNFQFAANTFNDIDVGDELTYSAQLVGGGELPSWLSFNPITRTFSGIPTSSDIGSLAIEVFAKDKSDEEISDDFILFILPVNSPPTLVGTGLTPAFTENGPGVNLFSGVSVSTGDLNQTIISIGLTISDLANGSFEVIEIDGTDVALTDGNNGITLDSGVGYSVDITGSTASLTLTSVGISTSDVEVLLENLQYKNLSKSPEGDTRSISIESIQDNGGTAGGGVDRVIDLQIVSTITLIGVNDAPTISAPMTKYVFSTVSFLNNFNDLSFGDVDAGSESVTVTFSLRNVVGSLSALQGSDLIINESPNSLELTGSITDINSFVTNNGVILTIESGTSNMYLDISINDNGNSGIGGAKSADRSIRLILDKDPNFPVILLPESRSVSQNGTLVYSSANGFPIEISRGTFDNNGYILVINSFNGTFSVGSSSSVPQVFLFGTPASLNTQLEGLTFTPDPESFGFGALSLSLLEFPPSTPLAQEAIFIPITEDVEPVVTSVTSSTANGIFKIGDELTISVNFSEAVTVTGGTPELTLVSGTDRVASYESGSGTSELVFRYIVAEGDFSLDLDYVSPSALSLNGAEIQGLSSLDAVLTLPIPGNPNSLSANKDFFIDGLIPSVASVSVPANGVYAIGQNLDFAVSFSEAVIVSGDPQLSLTIGATSPQASYVSGSGSNVLVFRYTVQSGDLDLNGIVAGTLSLNGGTVRDAAGNDANLTLNNISSTSQVLVDGVRPTVVSMSLGNTSLAVGETATLTLVLSERISGLEPADFSVDNGNLSGLTSSDGGLSWTATFTPLPFVEDDSNVVSLNNSGYTDLAGNTGTGTSETANYEIDTQRPTALVTVANPQLKFGETTLVSITFSEAVTGLELDDFIVSNGSLSDLESLPGGDQWQATLTPDPNVQALNNLITLDNTGYQDLAGNTGTGVSNSNNYSIDTQLPSGYSVLILADRINGVNMLNFRFRLLDGEPGSDYSFSISSSAGGSPVTGTGEVTSSDQLISGIVVEDLPDGFLTLTVTLTDESGNEGEPVSDTVEKLLPATLTIRVVQDAVEGGDDGEFAIETNNTFAALTEVNLEIGGTATPGEDYNPIVASIAFPGNTNSILIPVSVIEDLDVEGEETVIIRLVSTNNSLVTIGEPNEATITIADNDVPRQLTITPDANQKKVYGDDDPTTFSYTASGFDSGDDEAIIQGTLIREEGEDAGTYSFEIGTLNAGPNYDLVLSPAVFTITPATLSIEVDNLQKVYGAEDPEYTYTAAGFKLNDTEGIIEGTLGRNDGEDVGSYQFNLGTLSAGANYNLQLISNTPFRILPAPLRIVADDKQKIFGAANPDLTFTYDGLVNGDTQIQTLPTLVTTATETSPVGTYPIILNGGSDPNYSISRVEGILTIGRKIVTITASDQSKEYGEANPVLTFSYNGLLEGDTQIQIEPTIATEAAISSPVGSYDITLTGGSDPNYDFTLVKGTLTITPAGLTITADNQSKVYGEENPPLTFSYAGLVNGDTGVAVEPSISTEATASSPVASYPITLTGGSDPNYAITLESGTLTITPANLTITADDQSKVYGQANPPLTFSYTGLVNGDTEIQTLPVLTTAATETSSVGSYEITLTGGSDPNYAITRVNGTLTIGQRTVTITADDQSKVYGQANPVLTFSYNGLLEGDTQIQSEPTISTEATIGSPVGTYEITLSGGSDPNYDFTLVNGNLSVTPASLTITADDQQKIYGEANPVLTFSYNGLVNGDTQIAVEPTISTTATAGSNVGTYPITLSGGSDQNYAITLVNGTLTVGQKALTITADDKSKVYGEANPVLTFSYTGLVNGDTQVTTLPSISTTATASTNVGTYPITLSGGSDQNYAITLVNGTLTIGQKALTITADDKQKIYGEANPALTFSYNGLVNGDTQIAVEPTISTTATAGSNVGIYPITLSGGSDPNYAITLVNGTLTIGQKAVTITADDKQKIYGEANPALTFSYTGLVNGDTQITTEPSISTTATLGSNAGIYPITLSGGSDQNYAITLVNGTLTIGQKALTITADDKQKVYGEVNPTLTFTYNGLVNGDTQVTTLPSISTTATQGSNVGTYPITLSGGSDPNYAVTLVNGTLTVGQKALTITADDKSKVYGEANPVLTFSYTGLVNGDTQVTTLPSISTTATQGSNVGTYPITLSGGSDQNYAITLVNGTLTVGQKALTITADDKQKIYGEANPPLTFSYTGLVNGDTQVTTLPNISTTATQGSNVGTYPITLSGGSDQNYAITLVNGTLTVNPALLVIIADSKSKIFGNQDPELTFKANGFKLSDTEAILTGGLTRVQGETVGIYAISQGTLDAGGNYQIEFVGSELEIIPAQLAEFLTGGDITTPWSVEPVLSNQVDVLTQDGQILTYEVVWDRSTLNVFKRGTYTIFGTVNLPAGILNPSGQKAVLQVIVLPKPAPTDIILSNNQFVPNSNVFFQDIGFFTVIDEFDDIHTVELVPGAADNGYFEINSDILFWSSADEAAGVTEFTIVVRVTDRDGNVIEKSFIITRDRKDIEDIEVFNTFSPNGDGVNDTWGIPDLKYFRGGRVQVFDRSGQRVFYTESPAERWDGTFEGKELPVGAYFWILESRETGEVRRGVLNLIRR